MTPLTYILSFMLGALLGVLLLACLYSFVERLRNHWRSRRNPKPAAIQASCPVPTWTVLRVYSHPLPHQSGGGGAPYCEERPYLPTRAEQLELEMLEAVDREEYELAAVLRDQLNQFTKPTPTDA